MNLCSFLSILIFKNSYYFSHGLNCFVVTLAICTKRIEANKIEVGKSSLILG